jgi:hypothetical protein
MTNKDIALLAEAYEAICEMSSVSESKILFEKKFQTTTLMYHGTSSTFLRSILKNGLDPNPKQKSWDLGGSMSSLGGVYMAPVNARATRHAAKEAVNKYGGSPMLITIQVVTASGTPDEDNIFGALAQYAYEMYRNPTSPYNKDILNILKIKSNQQTPIKIEQFANAAKSIFEQENYPKNKGTYEAEGWLLDQPEIKKLMPSILNTMKPAMSEDSPTHSPNVRITRPIGFSGKTRIVKISNMETDEVYYPTQKT